MAASGEDDTASDPRRSPRPAGALERAGRYVVVRELGRGGMGRVLDAHDKELERPVAIKELLGDGDAASQRRFFREAHLTARLQHPSIVPVYDTGRWDTGEPYYVMRRIDGRTLREEVHSRASLVERLPLLVHVVATAEAVAYAHNAGIMHRDIKPANVIIGAFGETTLVDWGLAKEQGEVADASLASTLSPEGQVTETGDVLGTPAYMAPEQARGEAHDERADIYGLGALLHHVLAGQPPYPGRPIQDLEPAVPRELAAIVVKATAPAGHRYATAAAFADDVKRFMAGQLVAAHRYTRRALFRRWVRRHRGVIALASTAAVVLAVVSAAFVLRLSRARAVAEQRTQELLITAARLYVDRDPTVSLAWLKQVRLDDDTWPKARAVLADAVPRGVARHVWRFPVAPDSAVISADTRWVAAVGPDGAVSLMSTSDGGVRTLGQQPRARASVGISRDGAQVITVGRPDVSAWDVGTGTRRTIGTFPLDDNLQSIAVTPDGRSAVGRSDSHGVLAWPLVTPGATRTISEPSSGFVDLEQSEDGTIAIARLDRKIDLVSPATGDRRSIEVATRPVAVALSADGRTLLVGDLGTGGRLHIIDVASGNTRTSPDTPPTGIEVVALSPDARIAAAGLRSGEIWLWDVPSLTASGVLRGHTDHVVELVLSPDGKRLVSYAADDTVRVWDVDGQADHRLAGSQGQSRPAFSPDGRMLAAGDHDGSMHIYDVANRRRARVLAPVPSGPPRALAYRPAWSTDGKSVVAIVDGKHIVRWDEDGAAHLLHTDSAQVDNPTFVDADRAVAFHTYGTSAVIVIDATTGAVRCRVAAATYDVVHANASEVVFGTPSDVQALDVRGCVARTLYETEGTHWATEVSADRRWLVSYGRDPTMRFVRLGPGEAVSPHGAGGPAVALAVSADGSTAIAYTSNHSLEVWNIPTGERVRTIDGVGRSSSGYEDELEVSSDGLIFLGGADETVSVWDATSGLLVSTLTGVGMVAVSPVDPSLAVLHGKQGISLVRLADLPRLPSAPPELAHWLDRTSVVIGADGQPVSPRSP